MLGSVKTVWVLLALLAPFLLAATNPLEDDIWWTLKLGELIAAGHGIDEEVLTFPPHAWGYLNAQWLGQLWYHGIERALGLAGIPFVNALQLVAAFGLVLHQAWRRSGDLRIAATCTMAAAVIAATNFNPRAQTLAILFFAGASWLLHTPGKPRIRLIAIGAIAMLWANVHGSFWLGPALTLLLWLREPSRFLLLAALIQVLGSLANPHGLQLFGYVAAVVGNPVVRESITEWQPPDYSDLSGAAFYTSLALIAGLIVRRRAWWEAPPLLFFALLGLVAVRNLTWWALIAAPFCAAYLRVPQREGVPVRPVLNAALAVVILIMGLISTPWMKGWNAILPPARRALVNEELPQAAAAFIADHERPARVFAFQPWGGYLEWRLGPAYQLMVDGRIEMRPPEVWRDYAWIGAGDPAWQSRLESYEIKMLVLSIKHQAALVRTVQDAQSWDRVHSDGVAAVYVKR